MQTAGSRNMYTTYYIVYAYQSYTCLPSSNTYQLCSRDFGDSERFNNNIPRIGSKGKTKMAKNAIYKVIHRACSFTFSSSIMQLFTIMQFCFWSFPIYSLKVHNIFIFLWFLVPNT